MLGNFVCVHSRTIEDLGDWAWAMCGSQRTNFDVISQVDARHVVQGSWPGSLQGSAWPGFASAHVTTVGFQVANHCTELLKLALGELRSPHKQSKDFATEPFSSMDT